MQRIKRVLIGVVWGWRGFAVAWICCLGFALFLPMCYGKGEGERRGRCEVGWSLMALE